MAWKVPGFSGPPSPYAFKGNAALPYAGFGVAERGWAGTFPGAGAGQHMTLNGFGGFLVKGQIKPAAQRGYFVLPGVTAEMPIEGLTGGIYTQGQLTLTGLQQYQARQAQT